MDLRGWWTLAAEAESAEAAVGAWPSLSAADRKAVRAAVAKAKNAAGLLEDHVRALGAQLGAVVEEAELDALINSWPSAGGLSEHLALELAASERRGRPLEPSEPVPGCGCAVCTGIPADHPVRTAAHRRLAARLAAARASGADGDRAQRRQQWAQRVAQAKAVSILAVAQLLGLGSPEGRGKEQKVRCPLHGDEHPSLSLNAAKNLWYCHPCGEGGDALGLYMRVRKASFADAVRALTLDSTRAGG